MIKSCVILGSGNLAHHLARALFDSKILILQIFGRNELSGNALAKLVNSKFVKNVEQIDRDADIYIFAMNDTANVEISKNLFNTKNSIMVHTAGSLSMEIFSDKTMDYGVFYPFQTFSKSHAVDFSTVPICIEASNEKTLQKLENLALKLDCMTYCLSESQRSMLHLSGVFACNFMNHCISLGENILKDEKLPLDLLRPLLEQSFRKIANQGASASQTGPALRNDEKIIQKHLNILHKDKNLYDIYTVISKSIFETYKNNEEK